MGMRLVKDSDGSWELISQKDYEGRQIYGAFFALMLVACVKGWPGVIGAIVAQQIFPHGFGGHQGCEKMWIAVYFAVNVPYWIFKRAIFALIVHAFSSTRLHEPGGTHRPRSREDEIAEARARSDADFRRIIGR